MGLAPRLRRPLPPTFPVDFNVYYSAARLVRHGEGAAIYTGADTGANPQKLIAPAGSPIFHEAQAEGLGFVGLYVYPPILADLLLPFTWAHVHTASDLWLYTNFLFLLLTAALAARLAGLRLFSWPAGVVLLALLCFTPVLQCLHDGQITIFLLLLWVAGMVLYQEHRPGASALVFALAAAIKLTPLLVLLPFLIWRRWRFVGSFLLSLLGFTLLGLWINTPHAFRVYFGRVLPAMSAPLPALSNYSLAAATARLAALLHIGSLPPFPATLPAAAMLTGRLVSLLAALLLTALLLRAGRALRQDDQTLVLGLLGLVAPILSPVSWFHAYATAFIAFVLLWREALQQTGRPAGRGYLLLLTLVTLLLGSAVSENLLTMLAVSPRLAPLATWLQFGQLAAACGLVFYRLAALTSPRGAGHGSAGQFAQAPTVQQA